MPSRRSWQPMAPGTCSSRPTRHAGTGRWSASFRRSSASGLTPIPGPARPSAPGPWHPSCATTTDVARTAHWETGRRSAAFTRCVGRTTSGRNRLDRNGLAGITRDSSLHLATTELGARRLGHMSIEREYEIVRRPEPEGGFSVLVPELPSVATHRETIEEAGEMAKEAIDAYLEVMHEDVLAIPVVHRSRVAVHTA